MTMASRGIVGAGLIAVMLLTACGGRRDEAGGLPGALASASPTRAAPTVTSSPTPSATTSDGQAALRASAEQFVRNWYSRLNQANASASPELVKPLYLPSCRLCRRSVEFIEEDRVKHYRVVGNEVTVLKVARVDVAGTRAVVDVVTKADNGVVVGRSNEPAYGAQGWAPTHIRLTLVRKPS